jgi:hypothetical protein
MARAIPLPTTPEVDMDYFMKMVESYKKNARLATTLVAFANDLREQHEEDLQWTQIMTALNRGAVPQIVARSVTSPQL